MPEARRATVGLVALVALAAGAALLLAHHLWPVLPLPIDTLARYCRLARDPSTPGGAAEVPLAGMLSLGILLGGLVFALGRLARTLLGLRRIGRLLRVVPSTGRASDAALRVRARATGLGLAAVPLVADLGDRPAAFTLGLLRPRVVVSPAVVEALTDAELDALLLHEAAHARRRDPLRLLAARFCRDLLFFLPLPHALFAVVREAQEHAADDAAAEGAGPLEVAGALIAFLRVAGQRAAPRAVAAVTGADPEARIRRLLGARAPVRSRRLSVGGAAATLLIACAFAVSLAATPAGAGQGLLAASC